MRNIFLYLAISTALTACEGTTHYLASGSFTKNETYKVNSYYGCCGCEAKYFVIEDDKKKVEQVIYSYNCSEPGAPTKFVFIYDKKGKLLKCDRYVATTADDFTMPLSVYEKRLFLVVDTTSAMKATYTSTTFSEIRGFRKPVDKEVVHSFPLVKKGYKVAVE